MGKLVGYGSWLMADGQRGRLFLAISHQPLANCHCREHPVSHFLQSAVQSPFIIGDTERENSMRGAGMRLKHDVRRLWRCLACHAERKLGAEVTSLNCVCPGKPAMKLVEAQRQSRELKELASPYLEFEFEPGELAAPGSFSRHVAESAPPPDAETASSPEVPAGPGDSPNVPAPPYDRNRPRQDKGPPRGHRPAQRTGSPRSEPRDAKPTGRGGKPTGPGPEAATPSSPPGRPDRPRRDRPRNDRPPRSPRSDSGNAGPPATPPSAE